MAFIYRKVQEILFLIKKGAALNVWALDEQSLFKLLGEGKFDEKEAIRIARLLIQRKADVNARVAGLPERGRSERAISIPRSILSAMRGI